MSSLVTISYNTRRSKAVAVGVMTQARRLSLPLVMDLAAMAETEAAAMENVLMLRITRFLVGWKS